MCMTFDCNPPIFFYFFRSLNFVSIKHSDTGYFVNAAPSTTLTGSFRNFADLFVKF